MSSIVMLLDHELSQIFLHCLLYTPGCIMNKEKYVLPSSNGISQFVIFFLQAISIVCDKMCITYAIMVLQLLVFSDFRRTKY